MKLTAEKRFKLAVLTVIQDGRYPGPVQIRRELGRPDGSRTINDKETRWRRQVLTDLGWLERRWPHRYLRSWVKP